MASRTVFRETPSDAAVEISCKAVPGGNSPFRILCRRMEATWSATEILVISASSIFLHVKRGAVRHVALNAETCQVLNN